MEQKIQVLHLINSLGYGGAETLLMETANSWRSQRYHIHIAYVMGSGELCALNRNSDVTISDLSKKGRFSIRSFFSILQYIRKYNIGILHTHDPQSGVIGRIAVWCTLRKVIIVTTRHTQVLFGKQRVVYLMENLLLRLNDAVICISSSVQQALVQEEGIKQERTCVIHNAIDVAYFSPHPSKGRTPSASIRIGSVGRMIPQKGFDVLIDGFSVFHRRSPGSHLSILGDGEQSESLVAQVQSLNLGESVSFVGAKDRDGVRSFLRELDIFVLASRNEGFGIAAIEAMAMDIPVVASMIGGIKDIIVDGVSGLLFESENSAHLAEKIQMIAGDRPLREKLIFEGRKKVKEQFSIDSLVGKIESLYSTLIP